MGLTTKHSILGIVIIFFCCISFRTNSEATDTVSASLLTQQKVFEAGAEISLTFDLSKTVETQLFLHASMGSTLLTSKKGSFVVPDFMAKKRGVIDYSLLYNDILLYAGAIEVMPDINSLVQLESYIGPPSIIAGGESYTMQVVIATDAYDNPLPDSTAVHLKQQFLELEKAQIIPTKDLISWTNHYSYDTAGSMLIAAKAGASVSKEFTIEIQPSLAQNFQITSSRKHPYADGNQITEFRTTPIKDAYGNTISDGTLVHFIVKDTSGVILHAQGATINGVAKGELLHPNHPDTWTVKAYITGIAESNGLILNYEAVLKDFDIRFTTKNRNIDVGPLQSFMEQLIPDGAMVTLEVVQKGVVLSKEVKTSLNGMVQFNLEKGKYPSGTYTIRLEALGIQKVFSQISLE